MTDEILQFIDYLYFFLNEVERKGLTTARTTCMFCLRIYQTNKAKKNDLGQVTRKLNHIFPTMVTDL